MFSTFQEFLAGHKLRVENFLVSIKFETRLKKHDF